MMPPSADFQISLSKALLSRRRLCQPAVSFFSILPKSQFIESLKRIVQELRTEPETWGEPQYNLEELGLILYHGLYLAPDVKYAVHLSERIVFIKDIVPLRAELRDADNNGNE